MRGFKLECIFENFRTFSDFASEAPKTWRDLEYDSRWNREQKTELVFIDAYEL